MGEKDGRFLFGRVLRRLEDLDAVGNVGVL